MHLVQGTHVLLSQLHECLHVPGHTSQRSVQRMSRQTGLHTVPWLQRPLLLDELWNDLFLRRA